MAILTLTQITCVCSISFCYWKTGNLYKFVQCFRIDEQTCLECIKSHDSKFPSVCCKKELILLVLNFNSTRRMTKYNNSIMEYDELLVTKKKFYKKKFSRLQIPPFNSLHCISLQSMWSFYVLFSSSANQPLVLVNVAWVT